MFDVHEGPHEVVAPPGPDLNEKRSEANARLLETAPDRIRRESTPWKVEQ
jgi:hypothetical protein